jgi:hypothetical protein
LNLCVKKDSSLRVQSNDLRVSARMSKTNLSRTEPLSRSEPGSEADCTFLRTLVLAVLISFADSAYL